MSLNAIVFDAALNQPRQSPKRLAHHVREILSKGGDHDALVLFLDQMEELFTAQDPEATKTFLTALYQAAQEGALSVVATIRSDHSHHCHGHPDMLRLLRGKGHYPLGSVEPFMLADMIAKPARRAGLSISDNLVRRIAHETVAKAEDAKGSDQSNLPLLAFVLNQLFEQRADHELSEAVYKQLGGIKGGIAHHAATVEHTMRQKHGTTTAALLPTLLESLVILGAKGLPTRRRPLRLKFPSAMHDLIDTLVHERLLHTEGEGKAATVSISHEALFEAWPSLREYVAKSKRLMDQTLLDSRARKWAQMDKPWFSGLASGREYKDFRRAGMTATGLTREYLYASLRARWIQAGVIGLLILLFGGPFLWLWKEDATVPYAWSIMQARLHLVQVPAPETVPIPNKPYAMGRTEVTFEEYDAYARFTGRRLPDDSGWGREKRPVINVSWENAVAYAKWLKSATGKPYRLPTGEEWEYTATSGGKDEQWAGTSRKEELSDYAWHQENSNVRTQPVRTKKPNGLELYDMSGNVWEWVQDCYDKVDEDKCGWRVLRGGSWFDGPVSLRVSGRFRDHAGGRLNFIGFRLAQDTP